MKIESLIEYLEEQIEKARKLRENYIKLEINTAFFTGQIIAYEDALKKLKKDCLIKE